MGLSSIALRSTDSTIFKARPLHVFHVAVGDWDLNAVQTRLPIFETAPAGTARIEAHETIRALTFEGLRYRETKKYADMIAEIRQGRVVRMMSTESEVHGYLAAQARMIESMRTDGYLTQQQLGGIALQEAQLYVTRDGTLCHVAAAHHRMMAAEAIGIDVTPAVIRGAHPLWIRDCVERYRSDPLRSVRAAIDHDLEVKSATRQEPTPAEAPIARASTPNR